MKTDSTSEFPVLMAQNLCKVYTMGDSEVHALKGVSLMVKPGEFVSIMGTSGSGKSTLLQIVGCLDRPTTGKMFIEGQDVASLPDLSIAKIRNKKLGFVFQAFNLMPQETAANNVEVPLQYAGLNKKERRRMAIEALTAVGLADRIDHRPAELSGGQRQRVAIARAIVNKPLVILADEPTGALDSKSGIDVMAILQQLNEQGKTIIMVTHDAVIAEHAHRIVKISDGVIIEDQTVEKPQQARSYMEELTGSRDHKAGMPAALPVAAAAPVGAAAVVPGARGGRDLADANVCARCSSGNRQASKYCRHCGFPLKQTDLGMKNVRARLAGDSVRCELCGVKNRPIAQYCIGCGASMDGSFAGVGSGDRRQR